MIVFKNARLLDPSRDLDATGDLAIDGDRIAASGTVNPGPGDHVVDASGKWVTPGLVDFHMHFFRGASDLGVPLDAFCLPSGVTTAVDAGSAGFVNYPALETIMAGGIVRAFGLLNACPTGLLRLVQHESLDPAFFDADAMRRVIERHPGRIPALKIRASRDVLADFGVKPLVRLRAIADELGCRIVVHSTDSLIPAADLLGFLKKGDVFTHAFHGIGHGLVVDGRIIPAAWEARERGVLFDDCHGRLHFSFEVLRRALAEGFFPDMISSDAVAQSYYRLPLGGLPLVLSRYIAAGAEPLRILRACTVNPARYLGIDNDVASLRDGARADVALFDPARRAIAFTDAVGETVEGGTILVPEVTVRDGEIVYRSYATFAS